MKKIILASNSPRRREILGKFNIEIQVEKSCVEEIVRNHDTPEQVVMSLAFQKAEDVAKRINEKIIVIGADTVVVKDNLILGKPSDYKEAFHMLKSLSASYHKVITGVALIKANTFEKVVFYETTKVKMRNLSDKEIDDYIKTNEVWDKAGSYGIQSLGSALVESIEGDYFNVVGLPICKLGNILSKDFNINLI